MRDVHRSIALALAAAALTGSGVLAKSRTDWIEGEWLDGSQFPQKPKTENRPTQPVSRDRSDYPSRQAWRAATKPWRAP